MTRVHRSFRCTAAAAFALTLAAAVALAHPTGSLDLGSIETRVAAQIGSTAGNARLRAQYVRLNRTLHRSTGAKLSREIAKLTAVAQAVAGPLAGDSALIGLVPTAVDDADTALARLPDTCSVAAGSLASDADRARVEKAGLAAYALHQQGRTLRNPTDERRALDLFRRAAAAYEDAIALARRFARPATNPPAVPNRTLALLGLLQNPGTTFADVNALLEPRRPTGGGGTRPTRVAAAPGHIYTVVGNGEGGFNGDGREARRSSLYFVDEVKFGPDGLLYVLDWNNHMVRRVDADGTMKRICGSGIPGDSEGDPMTTQLNHPSSMAFDAQGRIYIAAWHNHKIKVYDPTGQVPVVVTIAGTVQGKGGDGGLATDAKFNLMPGVLRFPNGDLLITDAANQVIHKVDLSHPVQAKNVAGTTVTTGMLSHYAGTLGVSGRTGDDGPAASAALAFSKAQNAEPDGRMQFDPTGRYVYVVSGVAHCVRRIDTQDAQHTITTFAGNGTAGYSGDGGDATSAQLNGPSDVACAADGTVYISDSNNHAIRVVTPDGKMHTYAGGTGAGFAGDEGPVSGAKFNRPAGLEIDAAGNLYVCDRYNSRVRVIASAAPGALKVPIDPYVLPLPAKGAPPTSGASGTIDTYAGTGTLGFNGDGKLALDTDLYWPQDVTVDPSNGLVWFCDWNNHRIRRVEAGGTVTTVIGSGELGDTDGEGANVRMNHPTDLVFHPITGELWVAGWHTDKIIRLDGSTNDVIFMAGSTRGFDPANEGKAPKTAIMNLPSSLKFDAAGNWYICDEANRRVRYVNAAANTFHTLAGNGELTPIGDGGPALESGLDLPRGQAAQPGGRICISPDERWLYLAESSGHRVRRIDLVDPTHPITTLVGTGTAGYQPGTVALATAQLATPTDVDCDAAGNVYIADQDNHAVRKVDIAAGTISTIAGDGSEGYAGDGGPSAHARLRSPSGIYVDRSTGRLWIADTYNGVVRVIWE